jgi:hypothetical protein
MSNGAPPLSNCKGIEVCITKKFPWEIEDSVPTVEIIDDAWKEWQNYKHNYDFMTNVRVGMCATRVWGCTTVKNIEEPCEPGKTTLHIGDDCCFKLLEGE